MSAVVLAESQLQVYATFESDGRIDPAKAGHAAFTKSRQAFALPAIPPAG
jgi:hypothetical protein